MAREVTRRRLMCQALGVIGGTMVSGDLLPLLAEAATRKQILRVAVERDLRRSVLSFRQGIPIGCCDD